MIHVLATIELADGKREEFLRELQQLAPRVRAEEGCIEYGPAVDLPTSLSAQTPPRENVVTVVEKWESIEALEAHLVAQHMLDYRARVKSIVTDTRLKILRPV